MRSRAAGWVVWSLAGLSVALYMATVPLFVLVNRAPVPKSWDAGFTLSGLLAQGLFLAFPVVGALIASRHPRNPIGWICLVDGLLWMLSDVFDVYTVYGLAVPGSLPFPLVVAGLNNLLWVPAIGLLGTYMFLLFPNGRLPAPRWRPLAWISGVAILLIVLFVAFSPGRLENVGDIRNPFGLEGYQWLETVGFVILPFLPVCMLLSAASIVLRFRRSTGEERQQIKWIAFAASVIGVLYLIAMVLSLVFPSQSWFAGGSPLWMDLVDYVALLSFTLVPIAMGFAVLRYHLYDIDVIINRTLVYGSLTVTLALVYAGSVVSLQYASRTLAGGGSQLAIVASTLVIAALFNPLRRRIQNVIDRRFYRRKYNAARVLDAFSAKLRNETDLESLNAELLFVVRETMQPAYLSLWLRTTDREVKR